MAPASAITIRKRWSTLLFATDSKGEYASDPRCRDRSAEKAALEKALRRASGTWGGFQAVRPFERQRAD